MFFDTHVRILQKLAESGRKEFSTDMIKQAIDKVEDEVIDRMYQEYLKNEEAQGKERAQWRADENTIDRIERFHHEAEAEPVSWAEAAEDLDSFPELKDNHDMEMER